MAYRVSVASALNVRITNVIAIHMVNHKMTFSLFSHFSM
jgi:hypothetical protein